ncbi:MAG: histidine phosphatase family protein [Chloroflexota bacterium]
MKLFLVRHGETEWNKLGRFQGQQDIALNERGLAQARETAEVLAALKPTALYSSPLYRTMQVAEEISRAVELPVIKEEGFKELDLGDLEGVTGQEMRERWPQVYAAWRNKPATVVMPNGESLAQLQKRAWGALLNLEKSHTESDILVVVSHNFAIRCIIAKLLGMPLSRFHRMALGLSSICTLESNEAGRRLVCYNSTCHLSPESR